mgnify:CR=1 FL=1
MNRKQFCYANIFQIKQNMIAFYLYSLLFFGGSVVIWPLKFAPEYEILSIYLSVVAVIPTTSSSIKAFWAANKSRWIICLSMKNSWSGFESVILIWFIVPSKPISKENKTGWSEDIYTKIENKEFHITFHFFLKKKKWYIQFFNETKALASEYRLQ